MASVSERFEPADRAHDAKRAEAPAQRELPSALRRTRVVVLGDGDRRPYWTPDEGDPA